MKKILITISLSLMLLLGTVYVPIFAFTRDTGGNDISKESFTISINEFFPSFGTTDKIKNSSGKGIDNIPDLIVSIIPMLTTMMAVGATLMVIWGGFHMVLGGASSEQTEKGKGIMKDAIIGLVLGLLAYVIIAFLGNIFDI